MNVHPDYFGQGAGSRLLKQVVRLADELGRPMRLVSSTMNLNSFSLYHRTGFRPRMIFQDMLLVVPETGLSVEVPGRERVRPATLADVPLMRDLEREVVHIDREADLRYFVRNPDGYWHVSVIESAADGLVAPTAVRRGATAASKYFHTRNMGTFLQASKRMVERRQAGRNRWLDPLIPV